MPIPLRLPGGVWWLLEEGALDHELLHGEYQPMEMKFVRKLLRRDMTVVDVGAHHGIYTLLTAKGNVEGSSEGIGEEEVSSRQFNEVPCAR